MLEKFEKKVIDIKKKIGNKNIGITLFAIVCIIVLILMILLKKFKIQKQEVQDGYNKAMYDFVANVNNVESEMIKLKISNNDTYTLTTLASIFAKSNSAKSNLDTLPFSAESISKVSKFLTQVSDFSYTLMRDIINGDNIANYKEQIDSIYKKISDLSKVTEDIYNDLNSKSIKWDELEKIGDEKITNTNAQDELSSTDKIGKTFTEYEGIIYDGAFSDHIITMEPSYLKGEILTNEEVEDILRQELDIETISFIEEQDGKIPLYVYDIKQRNEELKKTIYATKQDGVVYQMISDRSVQRESISMDEATQCATDFLSKLGINEIKDTYYLKSENIATISFAAVQDDVLIYSDLIKVKVALDNGEILGIEANGYVYNHKEREINASKTIKEAREKLYSDLNVETERLCIIPTDSKGEVLTYEFMGTIDDKKFLVYINANTLIEEKIYILLETEGGTLAM